MGSVLVTEVLASYSLANQCNMCCRHYVVFVVSHVGCKVLLVPRQTQRVKYTVSIERVLGSDCDLL